MQGTQTLDTVRFRYDLKVCRVWARLEAWSWFGRRARVELSAVLFDNVIFEAPWRELTGGCEYVLLVSGDFGQGLEVCRVWVQSGLWCLYGGCAKTGRTGVLVHKVCKVCTRRAGFSRLRPRAPGFLYAHR